MIEPATPSRPDPTSDAEVLKRYQRAMADSKPEHDKVVQQTADFYAAYGLRSIQGQDFADLEKVWGDSPPEIGMMLSNVNTFWGSLVSSRREPSFPGFDGSPTDAVVGEMLNLLIRAGRRWGGSDAVDEQALTDLIVTGYSFTEQYLETTGRPPYRTKERWIPLSDIFWDKGAHLKNLGDAQEFIRRHHYSVDEAAARFHDHADAIRAMGVNLGGTDSSSAPGEGARALGGPAVSVSVTAADGHSTSGATSTRRLREIPVDDFQFTVWEELVAFDDPEAGRVEERRDVFEAKVAEAKAAAAGQGELYEPPEVLPYAEATWYRAKILAQSPAGSPKILEAATPIPGNRRLIRPMTAFPEEYLDGDTLRTRYFGFGRVLLGLQRLVSVAIRIYIEQEARRNRGGGTLEDGTFESKAAEQAWIDAQAMPGAWGKCPDGKYEKIHPAQDIPTPHVNSMKEIFRFLSVDLVSHMLGISDMSRGTFEGDRSAKFVATMQESATQMQSRITSAFTDYLAEGAVTMCKLLLDSLDAKDIDRLVGQQPLREGITGQKDMQTGELMPIMIADATGQEVPLTTGQYLKINAGEIFDHDVSFGLRPSAPSERMANAMLSMQHGWLKEVASLLPPGAGKILAPAALKASFAEGSDFADAAVKIQAFIAEEEERERVAAEAATEEGWVAFIQGLAATDFEKAASLMQQASDAVTGPQQGGGQPQIQ